MESQGKYKTILVIVSGLLVFYYFYEIKILLLIALAIGILSIFIPKVADALEWIWFKIAFVLGWINSRILLSIIYFIFLFPIALVSRLFTKDPLQIKPSNKSSFYNDREHRYSKDDLKNIW